LEPLTAAVVLHQRGPGARLRAARLEWQHDLSGALERQELNVVYRPQYDLRTGAVVAVEALVRWEDPARGDVLPDWFLSIAEDSGLIVPIGNFVIEQACHAAAWSAAGHSLRPRWPT
jgi:EAL domain-containing protein (putative c-di-GMP-specific phosphodiesterase class I)